MREKRVKTENQIRNKKSSHFFFPLFFLVRQSLHIGYIVRFVIMIIAKHASDLLTNKNIPSYMTNNDRSDEWGWLLSTSVDHVVINIAKGM